MDGSKNKSIQLWKNQNIINKREIWYSGTFKGSSKSSKADFLKNIVDLFLSWNEDSNMAISTIDVLKSYETALKGTFLSAKHGWRENSSNHTHDYPKYNFWLEELFAKDKFAHISLWRSKREHV